MADSPFMIIGLVIFVGLGLVLLLAWIVKKIARRRISIHVALLALLAAILIVPFAMNFTSHLMSAILHKS